MTERSDDSDASQLDGLPRHWPHEGVDTHQEQAATASLPDTSSPTKITSNEEITRPPQRRDAVPPPVVTDKRAVSLPEAAASYGVDSEIVASPEVLTKALPEERKAPEHTDNPDDLKEHLPTVAPVSSKRTTSAALEDPGIKDLGWRDDVPQPVQLIRGVDNESVFTLIRRFNKVRYTYSSLGFKHVCPCPNARDRHENVIVMAPLLHCTQRLTSCLPSASTVCPSYSFSCARSSLRPRQCDGRRVLSRQAPCQPRTALHDSRKYPPSHTMPS